MSSLQGLNNFEPYALFNVESPSDAVRIEVADRTGGVVPVDIVGDSKSINKDIFDSFITYWKLLRSAGRTYNSPEFKGHKLMPIAVYLAPKPVKLTCEPYTRHPLLPDGEDPETTIKFPITDSVLMSKHAWLAKYLPSKSATFSPNDDDQVAALVKQVAGEIEASLNVKNLLTKWGKASSDERKEAEKLLSVGGVEADAAVDNDNKILTPTEKPIATYEVKQPPQIEVSTSRDAKNIVIVSDSKDYMFVDDLKSHLKAIRSPLNVFCLDRDVPPGAIASIENKLRLERADILLYFTNSSIYTKYPVGETIKIAKYARVVPVLIRSSILPDELARLAAVPSKHIGSANNTDELMVEVVRSIRAILNI
jgi:hypothetical protein